MKKFIISSLLIYATFVVGAHQWSALGETSTRVSATIVWTVSSENAGNGIFSNNAWLPDIDWASKWAYVWTDNVLYWYFWLQNAWWTRFEWLWADQARLSWSAGVVNVTWYAWNTNAWWIAFKHDSWVAPNTTLNVSTWLFSWYAWSENLGWINMSWVQADIMPPTFSGTTIFWADNNKNMSISDVSWTFSVLLDTYSASSSIPVLRPSAFSYDFRKAKDYNYKLTDATWNYTTWTLHVVANIPNTAFDSVHPIPAATGATIYSTTSGNTPIANWTDTHNISVKLRDKYWNPVINDVTANKVVKASVNILNGIGTNQIPSTSPLSSCSFINCWVSSVLNISAPGFLWLDSNQANISADSLVTVDGHYAIGISSLAPTDYVSGYDLKLNSFNYSITSSIPWTWEIGNTQLISDKNFDFDPAYWVSDISVSWWWDSVTPNNQKSFTWTFFDSWIPWGITLPQVAHIFDISNPDTLDNIAISLNSPVTDDSCRWYSDQLWNFFQTENNCDYSAPLNRSSNTYWTDWTFWWTPKLNLWLPAPSSSTINYSSIATYTNRWVRVWHLSLKETWWVSNYQIKIAWNTNVSSKNMIVQSWSTSVNMVWEINKNDIKTMIYKNVETLVKSWVPSTGDIKYQTTNLTLNSWPADKETIIVKWANVFINWNILKEPWKIKWLVVLKDSSWNWWNIYVRDDVSYIATVIFADWWMISGDGSTYYADNDSFAQNQMFFKWSIVSNNTIGWSYKNPITCPYWVSPCNEVNSKRYDLNLFRHFIKSAPMQWTPFSWFGVDMSKPWYADAPIIIEYDSDIQTNSPEVFRLNQ
ncbi:MAG: hypothetical protein ACD_2C00274G0002 [uncultured bacterium (gcode 4)]|uniref:Uncharacterized protein n=1 Tax=uncultured bacterium (gcode 4) TaxID=1234023 RepID=K2G0W9_9BACT|nr:MAG: hypothetical protein ACD_2C00274G0002 [uncultured bacterium (gcode 4)]